MEQTNPATSIVTSPINTIPREIWREIFTHFVPKNPPLRPWMYRPIILCQVCQLWRTVALSTQALWATFFVETPWDERDISWLYVWLDLSRLFPLSFKALVNTEGDVSAHVFAILLSVIDRWANVDLSLNEDTFQQFLEVTPTSGLLLRDLRLTIDKCTNEQFYRLSEVLNRFTGLRRLSLTRSEHHSRTLRLDIQWSNLTDLYLDTFLPLCECVEILSRCSNLVNCTFMSITSPLNTAVGDVLLLKVAYLEIHMLLNAGQILSHLTCPSLRNLVIGTGYPGSNSYSTYEWSFEDFLSRSACSLESLRMYDNWTGDYTTYLTAPSLRPLKRLECGGVCFGTPELELLTIQDNGRIFIPHIETLSLRLREKTEPGSLLRMIASRFKAPANAVHSGCVTTLRRAQINSSQKYSRCDLKSFSKLRREGLNITWDRI